MEPSSGYCPSSPRPRPVPPPRKASGERKTITSGEHRGFWESCADVNDRGPQDTGAHTEGGKGQQNAMSVSHCGIEMQSHGMSHHNMEESHGATVSDMGQSHGATVSDMGQSHGATVSDMGQSHGATVSDMGQSHGAAERDMGQSHGAAERDMGQSHGATERDMRQSHGATVSDMGQSHAPPHDAAQSHRATEQEAEHQRPQNNVVQSNGTPGHDVVGDSAPQREDTGESAAIQQDPKLSQQRSVSDSRVISQPLDMVPAARPAATPNLDASQMPVTQGAPQEGSMPVTQGAPQEGSMPVTQGAPQQDKLPQTFRISEHDGALHSHVTTQDIRTHVRQQEENVAPDPCSTWQSHDQLQQDGTILQALSIMQTSARVGPEQCTMEAVTGASNSAPASGNSSLAEHNTQRVSRGAHVLQINAEELIPQPQSKTIQSSTEQHVRPERESHTTPGAAPPQAMGTSSHPSPGAAPPQVMGTSSHPSPGAAPPQVMGTSSHPSPGAATLSTAGTSSHPSPGAVPPPIAGTSSHPSPGAVPLSTAGASSHPSPGAVPPPTAGASSHPSPGAVPPPTAGTSSHPSPGAVPPPIAGTSSHPSPGAVPLSTAGASSHPSPGAVPPPTAGASSHPSPGAVPLSTAGAPSHSSLDGTSVSTAVAQSNSAPAAASVSTPVAPPRSSPGGATVSTAGGSTLSPVRVLDPSSPHRNISSKPPLPTPPRSNLYPGPPPPVDSDASFRHETASLSSYRSKGPAPDTLSYLDSVSLMSGTLESLSVLDDASSVGSDSEINGAAYRKTDKYGFLGGIQYSSNGETSIPVEISRQRELKWLDMFNHWDKWLSRRFQKVKLRCRKGIPSSLRAKAWQLLSNSHELLTRNPGKFEELERNPGDPKWLDVIEKDLHRQFPFHEMFAARGGHGQQDLYRILKAYTIYRPEEGYCQAQAPVAAVLLMHMPAEQAFWCLVQICDKYLPGYYSAGLEAIQLDGEIFFALLRRVCPMAYRHLKKFKIDPILYMTEWFMCIFSRTLPWASVLRVWDMFFCEGVKIVFRVGLVLLRHTLGSVEKLRSCQGMYETMEKLRSLPPQCMHEDILLPEVSSLPVTDALIERESNTQLRKWRENRGELQYRPSRRMHGARQINEEKLRLHPSLSGSRLSLSSLRRASPPLTSTAQPESMVVSEGLRPVLPSPTANKTPLGPPQSETKKAKEKQREQERKREKEEREERERQRKREKEERERERKREKEKEKEEKRAQKEREKAADSKQKKERKFSFRRKEPSSPASDLPRRSGKGPADGEGGAVHDTYF